MASAPDWEDVDWSRHPDYLTGVATEVEVIVRILNIAHVDTVNQSVYVKASLNLYWTDPRLAEREKHTPGAKLPPTIWGPWPELSNGLVGLQQNLLAKGLHDKTLGQMNAIIIWEGEINNPMNLRDFPFDLDFIDFIFVNERATIGLPGDVDNFKIVGQMNSFKLSKLTHDSVFRLKAAIPDFCEAGEAPPFMTLYQWDGIIPEWNLVGYRERAATFPVPKGGTKEAWVFAVLIERKSAYYFWKAVLPLSLVMFFSCGIGIFEVDDLANRMSMGTTMFLASFATLYVVGAELPKTHFLTSIDQVVVATLLFLAMMAANSWICYSITESGRKDIAEAINFVVLFGFPLVYVAVVLMAFLPAIERKGKALRQVSLAGAKQNAVAVAASASTDQQDQEGRAQHRNEKDSDTVNPTSESSSIDLDDAQSQAAGDGLTEYVVSPFNSEDVLWTGTLSSQTGFEETESKVYKVLTAIAGIPNVPAHEFYGMAGRDGAYIWLATKCVLLAILILMCLLLIPMETMREAWFAPIMGVVACALPSSGMPVAGGIVFVPTLTTFGGMDARDAIAFTAATQMVGVGILAPINWLFHDRRVFVRGGKGDLLLVVLIPSWLGVCATWLLTPDNDLTLAVFTVFVFFVALYTLYSVCGKHGAINRTKAPDLQLSRTSDGFAELEYNASSIAALVVIGFLGGFLVGVIGIGIEKLVFVYLTWKGVNPKHAGITSIMTVGLASVCSFAFYAYHSRVPYGFWLMGLPGILVGSTIGPIINDKLGSRNLLLAFAILCLVETVHNTMVLLGFAAGEGA